MTAEQYDVIVIGAGQGGGPLSTALARSGRKTAIIEREHVGGTCINEGCTPTKTMVASARVAHLARRGADYGINTGTLTIDMERVRQRKRDMVESFRSGSEWRIIEGGAELIMGEARFVDHKTIEISLNAGGTRRMAADLFIINTGTRPATPDLPGLDKVPHLNSTTIMELDAVPEQLLVIGGGFVGLEFGQMFHRFGSRVTVVQRGKRLLTREDADIAEEIAKVLREEGLEILLETKPVDVEKTSDGTIALKVESFEGERTLRGTHLLVTTGRSPNTGRLNPEVSGIKTDDKGFIPVNERLETNVPGIYAVGDVNGGPQLTHISYDDFRILRANLVEGGDAVTTGRLIPYTVFIDPQLGHVGLGEEEARKQGRNIRVAKMPMSYISRAVEVDEDRGVIKAIVDADTNLILGCAVLGIEGGELMAMLEIAMLGNLPYTTLKDAIFAHPTLAEGLNTLFSNFQE